MVALQMTLEEHWIFLLLIFNVKLHYIISYKNKNNIFLYIYIFSFLFFYKNKYNKIILYYFLKK